MLMQCLLTPFETHFHPPHAHFVHEETEAHSHLNINLQSMNLNPGTLAKPYP